MENRNRKPYDQTEDETPLEDRPKRRIARRPEDHRYEKFLELNFTAHQSEVLTWSKDNMGVWIYHGDAQRLIENGCSIDHAFDILSDTVEEYVG
jgi:hypothetical protein